MSRKVTYEELEALCKKKLAVKSSGFNDHHPELREGEVFHGNVDLKTFPDAFSSIGFKTKRLGKKSYDIFGHRMKDHRPMFVVRAELDEFDAQMAPIIAQTIREAVGKINKERL